MKASEHLKKVTGMQPRTMERQTRALSCVLPGGHTQKTDRAMSASVSWSGHHGEHSVREGIHRCEFCLDLA